MGRLPLPTELGHCEGNDRLSWDCLGTVRGMIDYHGTLALPTELGHCEGNDRLSWDACLYQQSLGTVRGMIDYPLASTNRAWAL